MDVGKLNQQINIRQKSGTTDAGGGRSNSWSTIETVWGSIEPLRGSERGYAMQVDATTTHKIVIRYNANLTQEDQLTTLASTFRPNAIINVDVANRVMEVLATDVTRGAT